MIASGIWRKSPRPGKPGVHGGFWLVSEKGDEAWFKNYHQVETANEYIVSKIGQRLDVPVPKVQFFDANLQDGEELNGSISFAVPNAFQFHELPDEAKNKPDEHIVNLDELRCAFVMDVWINNTDRNYNNILCTEEGEGFKTHFIDHGRTVNCPHGQVSEEPKCLDEHFCKIDLFYYGDQRIRGFFYLSIIGWGDIEDHINCIEQIDDNFLEEIVANIPPSFLCDAQKDLAIRCLQNRKPMVRNILDEWAKSCGKV